MKKLLILGIIAILATIISSAYAVPQLRLTSGADTITITDGDANDQLASTPGVVYYNGPVGPNWTINVTIGITKPGVGTATEPYMDLDTTSVSQNAGDLEIDWTDTDFTATNGTWEAQAGGTTDGTVEFKYFLDSNNTPFGTNYSLADFPGLTTAYAADTNGTFSIAAPYSMTIQALIHHDGHGSTGFDSSLQLTPPQTPPTIQCAGDTDLGCNPQVIPGCDTSSVTVTAPCGVSNITCAVAGPDIITGCVHERDLVYTATDNCGQSASCTQHIFWRSDTTPPTFNKFPGDRDLGCNPATIPACDTSSVGATDNCTANPTITCSSSDSVSGCTHARTITYVATDACRNSASRVQHITWTVDITPPTLTVCDITNYVCGTNCTYVTFSDNATDDCGTPLVTYSPASGSKFCLGTNIVTVTATDNCLNQTVKTFKLIIAVNPTCGGSVGHGDTATIGFWHNKNGQALINAMPSPGLGNYLASNYPCIFGNLLGASDATVAAQFMTYFKVTGQKTYAQVMAGALADYVTSTTLSGGTKAGPYGFNTSPGGTGAKSFNVGSNGTVLGLNNNTSYTVAQILAAAQAKCPWSTDVFNALNTIFDGINQGGDIN